jgi:adenine phosphoribosyltransferase
VSQELIKNAVTTIIDYPKPGIMFRDVTSVLQNHEAFQACIDLLKGQYGHLKFDKVWCATGPRTWRGLCARKKA